MHILLVEDDSLLAESMMSALKRHGYTPDWVDTGELAIAALATQDYLAVILDLTLPDIDGLQVLQHVRNGHNHTPILILSARSDIEDKIKGLDLGADDYLSKPFALEELLARLRVFIRRQSGGVEDTLTLGALTLHLAEHQIYWQNAPLKLTGHEFKILAMLMLHADKVVTKDQLQQSLHGWEEGSSDNAIEVHIHHLRKKIDSRMIQNIRGVGYVFSVRDLA